jgi:hypothetical protein
MTKEMGKQKNYVRKEICKRIFLKLWFRVNESNSIKLCQSKSIRFLGFNLATKRPHSRRWRAAKTNRLSPVQSSTEIPSASGRWEFIKWVSPIMFPNFPQLFFYCMFFHNSQIVHHVSHILHIILQWFLFAYFRIA